MANNSVENASKNTTSLLLADINLPIALEWELFVINENKVSSFSLDRLESNSWPKQTQMKQRMLIAGFNNQLQLHTKLDLKNSRFQLSNQMRIPG